VRFSFIAATVEEQELMPAGVRFPVDFMCRVLAVTRQGYYAWKSRPPSARSEQDAELAGRIRYLHEDKHKGRAGIERITWDLQEEGHQTSERRVRRLARANGLKCIHPGPSARTTIRDSAARAGLVDLVERDFSAPAPDQLWVGDITYIWTYSGFAYLATLIDMHSNKVVGWAVADHMRTSLVLEALGNAVASRSPGIGELIIHHDRGSQYTSNEYRDRLFAAGIIPSVGRTGICYDNAAAESFNATIKKELIYQHVWRDAAHVRTAVFSYVERYYNRVRKQRKLGRISPEDYETAFDKREDNAAQLLLSTKVQGLQ
jgi:putative transposase